MQWNKKSASLLAVSSLLLGSAGAIGLQVHAQQSPVSNLPVQIQTQSVTPAVSEQENSTTDKDNIKDQKNNDQSESALEQADGAKEKSGVEVNENLSGGGHQDQDGTNADHQFEGEE